MSVSVAQHAETVKMSSLPFEGQDLNWGRGYHQGKRDHAPAVIARGANFQEQWDEAIRRDPPFVFVTGWNEWIAARFYDGRRHFMVDLADAEFSRDAEMMEGGWGDAFYLQLIRNIRRYKENRAPVTVRCEPPGGAVTFRDYRGDTADRDAPGVGGGRLIDRSGRNDIIAVRISCDPRALHFTAQTAQPLTRASGGDWMRLRFGVDTGAPSGEGLPYVVRFKRAGRTIRGELLQKTESVGAVRVSSDIKVRARGTRLEVTIPRSAVGAVDRLDAIRVKWSDNSGEEQDPMNAYRRGDAAPDGSLVYVLPVAG